MCAVSILREDPRSPEAGALLRASHDLMGQLFPQEANHFLSVDALAGDSISFFVAREDDAAVGCVALAECDGYGEVKSMFVAPGARGKGVADRLLSHLEAVARDRRLAVLKLETGTPGLEAAHRLYERHGFRDCAAFGTYEADAPYSRYMELSL